jgi:hypothetical protein
MDAPSWKSAALKVAALHSNPKQSCRAKAAAVRSNPKQKLRAEGRGAT